MAIDVDVLSAITEGEGDKKSVSRHYINFTVEEWTTISRFFNTDKRQIIKNVLLLVSNGKLELSKA